MIPQLVTALNAVTDKSGSVACIDGGTLLDDVKRACKRAGVTEVSCHGLRHSFASLCYFLKDIPDRQIMLWGGWASSATLHKIYIRLTEKGQTDAKDSFTAFFEQKEKGQS